MLENYLPTKHVKHLFTLIQKFWSSDWVGIEEGC